MLITAGLAGGLLLFGVVRWRWAVIGALFLAVFEGGIRKWAVPELYQIVYLGKDLLLLGAYVRFYGGRLLRREPLVDPHPANLALVGLAVLAFVELLNPNVPNIFVGLFGIKAYLFYVPLLSLMPALLDSPARARRFVIAFLLVGLIPLVLGPIQFASPLDSPINRYAWDEELMDQGSGSSVPAPTGALGYGVRVTGTFSYITTYTAYLLLLVPMALAWSLAERRAWFRWLMAAIAALGLGNILLTGSRGPVMLFVLTLPLLLLAARRGLDDVDLKPLAGMGVILTVLAMVAASVYGSDTLRAFERFEFTDDLGWRLADMVTQPVWALGESGLIGYGVGTTHQAILFVGGGSFGVTPPPEAEGEWERIILEIGPLGFALVIAARLLVIARLWRGYLAARSNDAAPLILTGLVYCVAHLPSGPFLNHIASIYYWALAGTALIAAPGAAEAAGAEDGSGETIADGAPAHGGALPLDA